MAKLSYTAQSVPSSLFRNGKVYIRRDLDGNDSEYVGHVEEFVETEIGNARLLGDKDRRKLDLHGFELINTPISADHFDFYNHENVVRKYYGHCTDIIRQSTGASHVFAFDHNIRSKQGKSANRRIAGGQQVQAPIYGVHGDYTLTSAPQRLRDLGNPPGANDTLRPFLEPDGLLIEPALVDDVLESGSRYAFINLWRNIDSQPVLKDPLALCDGNSFLPEDLVVFEIHYSDRIGENYVVKYSPNHRWWYYPEITRDEAVLIKQWDSHGAFARSNGATPDTRADGTTNPCTFNFHTAFEDPATEPDAPERQSIEVRCVAIF